MDTDKISKCICTKCGYSMPCPIGSGCPECPKCKQEMIIGSNVFEMKK